MKKIVKGNSIDLLKDLDNNSIDLICTDPPYKITSRGSSGNAGGMMSTELSKKGKIFNDNDIEIKDYASDFYRILKDNSHCYIMCNHNNLQDFINEFTKVGFRFTKSLIWVKNNKIMGRYYMNQFEYILFFQKGNKQINNCGTSDILSFDNIKTKDKDGKNIHDTQKPISLMKVLVENSSNENDLVLDPFFGSGSTIFACNQLNRNFIGFEINDKYFDYVNIQLTNREKLDKRLQEIRIKK